MYSENQRYSAVRRSNDEFLRKMLGGELSASCGQARCGTRRTTNRCANAYAGQTGDTCTRGACKSHEMQARQDGPACNEGDSLHHNHDCGNSAPWAQTFPSLAMVYSPMQSFENRYEPSKALQRGTLFADLDLPLEGCNGKEGCARGCRL